MSDEDPEFPELDPVEQLFKMRSEFDQMIASVPEFARAAWAFFEEFKKVGFTEKQAMYLTAVELVRDPGEAP